MVDAEDYERLSRHKWHIKRLRDGSDIVYARRMIRVDRKQTPLSMHREILGARPGTNVDHINRDGLDNRKVNLRLCSPGENMMNRKPQQGTSRFKGVYWNQRDGYWIAKIQVRRKGRHLGCFEKEEDAARAYDAAALEAFREFARLNFPKRMEAGDE